VLYRQPFAQAYKTRNGPAERGFSVGANCWAMDRKEAAKELHLGVREVIVSWKGPNRVRFESPREKLDSPTTSPGDKRDATVTRLPFRAQRSGLQLTRVMGQELRVDVSVRSGYLVAPPGVALIPEGARCGILRMLIPVASLEKFPNAMRGDAVSWTIH